MKNKKNKTYMFGVKITISFAPSLHYETIAQNEKEALVDAREFMENHIAQLSHKELLELVSGEITQGEYEIEKITTCSMGRASQYHSSSECKLCTEVEKK